MKVFYRIVRIDGDRDEVLSQLLGRLGLETKVELVRDDKKRLHFAGASGADLSLSRAEPFAVYAVGNVRVGVDMEEPCRIRRPHELAKRFFTEDERAFVSAAKDAAAAACLIWTKKEALAKYLGDGLAKTYHLCTCTPPCGVEFHSLDIVLDGRTYVVTLCVPVKTEILEG